MEFRLAAQIKWEESSLCYNLVFYPINLLYFFGTLPIVMICKMISIISLFNCSLLMEVWLLWMEYTVKFFYILSVLCSFVFRLGWFEWYGDFYYFVFYCLFLALVSFDNLCLVIFDPFVESLYHFSILMYFLIWLVLVIFSGLTSQWFLLYFTLTNKKISALQKKVDLGNSLGLKYYCR